MTVTTRPAPHDVGRHADDDADGGEARSRGDEAERRYQLLLDTSLELASSLDLDEVLQSAARRLSVTLRDPRLRHLPARRRPASCCAWPPRSTASRASCAGRELSLDEWPRDRLAIESRRAVTFSDVHDPRLTDKERDGLRAAGQRSFIALPLIAATRSSASSTCSTTGRARSPPTEIGIAEAVGQARGPGPRARPALRRGQAPAPGQPARPQLGAVAPRTTTPWATPAGWPPTWPCWAASWAGPRERLEEAQNVAFLHDIGKIGVSDRVLLKAGPLTSEEWELVRQHPGISAEIVRPLFDEELVAGGAPSPRALRRQRLPGRPGRRRRSR